jgi:drug/metabolite transporter (DMT)-like permease
LLALLTAIVWASSVILFRKSGESVHPLALNFFKTVLAALLMFPTLWLIQQELIRDVPISDYMWLIASGILGIAFADTLFFKSLNLLGAGVIAIVDSLYSPFVIVVSLLWLGEIMTGIQFVGTALIISALLTVTHTKGRASLPLKDLLLGLFWSSSSLAMMAVGIVMIKPLLERTPLLWALEIRLLSAAIALTVILAFNRERREIIKTLNMQRQWRFTLLGSFLGAYLSTILWMGGMKFTKASVAGALNQTANIFIFIFAAIFLKEPITKVRLLAIILAIGGAFMVFFGGI